MLDEEILLKNLNVLTRIREKADVQIIQAFKAFAMWPVFDQIARYLDGATASSLYEARLCYEEMRCKAHTYAPAYLPHEFEDIMKYSSHITFNSLSQFEKYKGTVQNHITPISMGLRVNPEYSEIEIDLYNPAAKGSRLGEDKDKLKQGLPTGIEGLHFHALCENNSYALEKVLKNIEQYFGHLLSDIKWINFGGGHFITNPDYDVEHLIQLLMDFKSKYDLNIILEPGAAVVLNAGHLVSTVLDIVDNHGIKTAILDVSFTCHMPDTLEMPYRPEVIGARKPKEREESYRLGGVSCLAGDRIGDYTFEKGLKVGDKIVLTDMMQYTMVKTTMFNGVKHPDIAMRKTNGEIEVFKRFVYEDFKGRLG